MGKLSHIKAQIRNDEQRHNEYLAGLLDTTQKALESQIRAVYDKEYPEPQDVLKPLETARDAILDAIESIPKPVDYSGEFEALEAVIKAEISAIPVPEKMPKVDLKPVLDAIKAIPRPEKVEMPTFPEPKTQWTFDVKRNRSTGLIESIDVR